MYQTISSEDTLSAKLAFEAHARHHGVDVKHYHSDNGRFVDTAWTKDCEEKGQSQSFCGVNAHWQNGIAEKRIHDLRELARTQIIHAKVRWPAAVDTRLWPYAVRNANGKNYRSIESREGMIRGEVYSKCWVLLGLGA